MADKFRQFFTLAPDADDFQKRIFAKVAETNSMMDCYNTVYQYIIAGLYWRSRKTRHDVMDDRIDIRELHQQTMDDAEQFFEEGTLAEWQNRVWFEYLTAVPQPYDDAGPNTFVLKMDPSKSPEPQFAYRQVQLYLQILIYNQEYDLQAKYRADKHIAAPLPNSKIAINPSTARVDPDNPGNLSKFVQDLLKWMTENYPDLKALAAVKTIADFFNLTFSAVDYEVTRKALESMLNSIRAQGDSSPAGLKKAFRNGAVFELAKDRGFWSNPEISNLYSLVVKLSTSAEDRFYTTLSSLFADFLSPNRFGTETADQARDRRNKALADIKPIFVDFQRQVQFKDKYDEMIEGALTNLQRNFPLRYISTLLQADATIPKNSEVHTVLPSDLANALKEKADEVLRTLTLSRHGKKVQFFTVQNYSDLSALNSKAVSVPDDSKSTVYVLGDPSENKRSFYRPVYRSGFRTYPGVEKAISFGNLPETKGVFYYRNLADPATAVIFSGTRVITIDFQRYTIEYPDKKNEKTRNDKGLLYRSKGVTKPFFDDVKKLTKWKQIKGGRRYDPYYATNPGDVASYDVHLSVYVAAARGAARVLPLGDDSLCLWFWNLTNPGERKRLTQLGKLLGLPVNREIVAANLSQLQDAKPCNVVIGGQSFTFENLGLSQFRPNGFYYQIIKIVSPADPTTPYFYARVNTPVASVASVLAANNTRLNSRPLTKDPRELLALFDFSYYRCITATIDPKTSARRVTEDSKVIQLYTPNDNRKPSGTETVVIHWPDTNYDAVGANLPICFNIAENIVQYFKDKRTRGKMINKGNPLFREAKPRKDAGTAMGATYTKLKPDIAKSVPQLSKKKVPATPFANAAMKESEAVKGDWGKLKIASGNYLPINQEWCHLRGHGDGGDEYPGNFVSGSYHCNTEQLAIETGQRLITQQGVENAYLLHTTAYMLRDATDYESSVATERKSQVLTGNYLQNQLVYQQMRENHLAQREAERDATNTQPLKKHKKTTKVAVPILEHGDVAPLAAYIRYKVMKTKPSGTLTPGVKGKRKGADYLEISKYFDFIFEGQSEFIDKNQFTILSQAVYFALAGSDEFEDWYAQSVKEMKK